MTHHRQPLPIPILGERPNPPTDPRHCARGGIRRHRYGSAPAPALAAAVITGQCLTGCRRCLAIA